MSLFQFLGLIRVMEFIEIEVQHIREALKCSLVSSLERLIVESGSLIAIALVMGWHQFPWRFQFLINENFQGGFCEVQNRIQKLEDTLGKVLFVYYEFLQLQYIPVLWIESQSCFNNNLVLGFCCLMKSPVYNCSWEMVHGPCLILGWPIWPYCMYNHIWALLFLLTKFRLNPR